MSELEVKSFKTVAIEKNLEVPDEDTGLVLNKHSASLKAISPATSVAELHPTDQELKAINRYAVLEQKASRWIVLRNVNPIGVAEDADSDSETFSNQMENDMVAQAPGKPVLLSHVHDYEGPPAGICIAAKMTSKGPRLTLAFPLEAYNEDVIKGVLNGTMHQLSVGLLVDPRDKICTSCQKSIYSYACPHEPGDRDEKGDRIVVCLNKLTRWLEVSLVHVPARLGTSTKALRSMEDLDKYFTNQKADPFGAITLNTVVEQGGPNTPVHVYEGESISEALGGAVIPSERKEKSHIDTIETVNKTIEGSIVADKAQEDNKELDTKTAVDKAVEDAKAAEDTSKAAEDTKSADEKSADEKSADEKAVEDTKAADEKSADEKAADEKANDNDADDKAVENKAEEKGAACGKNDMKSEEKSLSDEALTKSVAALEDSYKKFLGAADKVAGFDATVKALVETNKAQGETIQKLLDGAAASNKHMEAQNERIEKLLGLQEELAKSVKEAMEVSSQTTLENLSELVNAAVELSTDNKSAKLDLKSSDWTKTLLSFNQATTK